MQDLTKEFNDKLRLVISTRHTVAAIQSKLLSKKTHDEFDLTNLLDATDTLCNLQSDVIGISIQLLQLKDDLMKQLVKHEESVVV